MSTAVVTKPTTASEQKVATRSYKWTVDQYERMVEYGILTEDDPVELLRGLVTNKLDYVSPSAGLYYRWTLDQYERMVEVGILGEDEPVELLHGELIQMSPQGSRHSTILEYAADALREAVAGQRIHVRTQVPLHIPAGQSRPEPDIMLVEGDRLDYLDAHPTTALLIVEVSMTTLAADRTQKLSAYALSGIPEYWIINLNTSRLEVYRQPEGEQYIDLQTLGAGETVTPLTLPEATLSVDDLIP